MGGHSIQEGTTSSVAVDQLGNTLDEEYGSLHHYQNDVKFTINDLPIEILINIFSNLDPIQLSQLRLVCKHWNYAVMDKNTWNKSFTSKFGTNPNFPSVSGSRYWMIEYFNRMKIYKKWNKGIGIHKFYQLINNEYGFVDHIMSNFEQDKILTFSQIGGNIAISDLSNGKNQAFIPGPYIYRSITSYCINWNYLLTAKYGGGLFLKNLLTSTSSSATKTSTVTLIKDEPENGIDNSILATTMNDYPDKHKERCDIISASKSGKVQFWNLNGDELHNVIIQEPIFKIKSDFKNVCIALTPTNLILIDYKTFQIRKVIPHGLGIIEEILMGLFVDIDFGGSNIIICLQSMIKVINYKNLQDIRFRELVLADGVETTKGKLQTLSHYKLHSRDDQIVGHDGLFYANILSDDSVIIWNVREESKVIKIQTEINPVFNKYTRILPEGLQYVVAMGLNSSVIAISTYNGITNLYNVFTGEYLKECSLKYPKKYVGIHNSLVMTKDVQLSTNQNSTNGIIICGDVIQYFQYGDLENSGISNTKKKSSVGGAQVSNKQIAYQHIKDQMEDYDIEMSNMEKKKRLLDKYNGDSFENEEEELSIAIALSQSQNHNPRHNNEETIDEEEQLRLAIEMSKSIEHEHNYNSHSLLHHQQTENGDTQQTENGHQQTQQQSSSSVEEDEEEQLKRIIEMSLIDQ